jgi:hypothetical protein
VALACIAALLTACEGRDTARPDWLAQPVILGEPVSAQLVGVDSGLCLQIGGNGYSDRDPAELAECNDSPRQQFRMTYKTSGDFQAVNVGSGKCLDVDSASTTPMARIFQWACGDNANQQLLVSNRGSLVQLQARHSGQCLDVEGGARTPGTPIIQWPCSTAQNQLFWLMPSERPKPRRP